MASFQHNNGTLDYSDIGEGTPVVLIHGFAGDKTQWQKEAKELSKKGCRVITPSLRGFGDSTVPDEVTPYSHAEDLHALLESLEIKGPHIVGHSFGAQVALNYAEGYANDETVGISRVTLVSPGNDGSLPQSEEDSETWSHISEAARQHDIEGARSLMGGHSSMLRLAERDPEAHKEVTKMAEGYSFWHFNHRDPVTKLEGDLKDINCPVTVIVGKEDAESNQRMAEKIVEGVRPDVNSNLVKYEGMGHFVDSEASSNIVNGIIRCREDDEHREETRNDTVPICSILL